MELTNDLLTGLARVRDEVSDQLQHAIRWSSDALSVGARQLKPPVQKQLAALRWGSFGYSTTVPFPSPGLEDTRLLLSVLGLAKVLVDEYHSLAQQHRERQHLGRAGDDDGDSSPLYGSSSSMLVPPVTLGLAALAAWRYFNPVLLREVCLSPYCVVERKELARLFSCAVVHLDATHLITNLAALLPDAVALERQRGSAAFAADLAIMTAMSSGLFVGWSYLLKELRGQSSTYYAVGAIGLSSLAFSLQVVCGEARRGAAMSLFGCIPVPAPYAWAVQLGVTHLFTPEASFAGHMCGVVGGIMHAYVVQPAMRWLGYTTHHPLLLPGDQRRLGAPAAGARTYGAGTTGGRRIPTAGARARRSQLLSALTGAAMQLGLAGLACALYTLSYNRRQRPPMSSWRFT